MRLKPTSAGRGEDENGETAPAQILLVAELAICGDQHVESAFRHRQQLTVAQQGPAQLEGGGNDVLGKQRPQGHRGALIEENAHAEGLRPRQAARRVFKHGLDLGACDPGKPLQKLIDTGPVLEVLEQRPDRDPRPLEDPHATDLLGIPLHRLTLGPLEHAQTVPGQARGRKRGSDAKPLLSPRAKRRALGPVGVV